MKGWKQYASILALLCMYATSFAQPAMREMVEINIDKTSEQANLLVEIKAYMAVLLYNQGIIATRLDEETLNQIGKINIKNERAFRDYIIPKDTLQMTYSYRIGATEDSGEISITSERHGQNSGKSLEIRPIKVEPALASESVAKELIAYDIVSAYYALSKEENYALTEDNTIRYEYLKGEVQKIVDNREAEAKKRDSNYTLMSFLPPVNLFRSHTKRGTANGIGICAGYAASIGGFIVSTTSYNASKRNYDTVASGSPEAEKARNHYQGNMDKCRAGQIASAGLFAATYIYGVVNALSNRDAYQGQNKLSLAPIAYNNGAGLAIVYKF